MSVHAYTYATEKDTGDIALQMTLYVVAMHVNVETGRTYASIATLMREAKVRSDRTMRNYLAHLAEMGFIKREKRRREDGSFTSDEIELCGFLEWNEKRLGPGVVITPARITAGPMVNTSGKNYRTPGRQVTGHEQYVKGTITLSPEQLAKRLGNGKASKTAGGWVTSCPAHEDDTPSLSISNGRNGGIVVHCHAGCSQADVIASIKAMGLSLGAGKTAQKVDQTGGISQLLRRGWSISKSYAYRDVAGDLQYENVRLEYKRDGVRAGKTFRQRRPDGRGGWVDSLGTSQRIPYRLNELVRRIAEDIHLAEGEKDADTLARIGLLATSIADPGKTDLSVFKDRIVFLHVDNDEAGRKKAFKVCEVLRSVALNIRAVHYPDTKDGGDVTDWLAAGKTLEDLLARCEESVGPALPRPTGKVVNWRTPARKDIPYSNAYTRTFLGRAAKE